jgi:hypothetical protein
MILNIKSIFNYYVRIQGSVFSLPVFSEIRV